MCQGFLTGSYQAVSAVYDPLVHVSAAWKCISAFWRNAGFICDDAFACRSNSGRGGNRADGNYVLAFVHIVFWPGTDSFGTGFVSSSNLLFPISD